MFSLHVFMCTSGVHGDHGDPKRGVRTPGTEIIDVCEPPWEYWELNLGPLQEQQLFLMLSHSPGPSSVTHRKRRGMLKSCL